jgi:diacylglycerol kinase family enzyme
MVVVIYNPRAGRARRVRETAGRLGEIRETWGPGTATRLAQEAARQGAALVLACGGDGTVNEVINGVAGTETAVGVLPAGTANALALELGLPGDPVRAAEMIPEMTVRRVALGRVTCEGSAGRYFVLACGAGLDAELMARAETIGKKRWGMLAYWAAGISMLGQRPEMFRAVSGQRSWECSMALACRVRKIGGGLRLGRRSHLLDEEMDLVLFRSPSTWRYIGYLGEALLGRAGEATTVRGVQMTGRASVEADGEVVGRLPARVEVAPGAGRLLGPWTT